MDETRTNASPAPEARRRLLTGAAILLVLAVLIITPPLINLNRLQHRITASISASLGRQVYVDPGTTFHIFPIPGVTLKNLVVTEDPAFGNEPVIRANEVTAQLRLSSLWRRQVEFSRITFNVDDQGSGASLNLVRNADGRWNIASLLMNASRIDAAPTTQKRPGSAPRFPYIEAKGARINLKLGAEKMPFSLTNAEFALWLPSSQQWRFQLHANPSRTDSNVADPGEVRAEGSMQRSTAWSAAPVDLHASWHDAPLGEASRLLTGNDAGWRGTLQLDTEIRGTLSASSLTSSLTLNDLRRADFIPAYPLDIAVNCIASANIFAATIQAASCQLPDGAAQPAHLDFANANLHPGQLSLERFSLKAKATPLAWLYGWFKLLSPRTPQEFEPTGALDTMLTRDAAGTWTGSSTLTLPSNVSSRPERSAGEKPAGPSPQLSPTQSTTTELHWALTPPAASSSTPTCTPTLTLAPYTFLAAPNQALTLSGSLTPCGYTYQATGEATRNTLTTLGSKLPTLADGVLATLPSGTGTAPQHLNTTCTRTWGDPQTCTEQKPPPPTRKKPHRR